MTGLVLADDKRVSYFGDRFGFDLFGLVLSFGGASPPSLGYRRMGRHVPMEQLAMTDRLEGQDGQGQEGAFMSSKSMDVFALRDSIVGEYRRFATSFTTIHAGDCPRERELLKRRIENLLARAVPSSRDEVVDAP